jgi:hypothetical protein
MLKSKMLGLQKASTPQTIRKLHCVGYTAPTFIWEKIEMLKKDLLQKLLSM